MENISHKKENPYDLLKKRLLSQTTSFEKIRDELLEKDQSDLSRSASLSNLEFLNDPEIVAFVQKNKEITEGYYRFLSFTEFHVAQNLIATQDAIKYFENALTNAKKGKSDEGWIAYIEGTILYLKGQNIPDEIIEKTVISGNDRILKNFNLGLKERGTPSYLEDYSK